MASNKAMDIQDISLLLFLSMLWGGAYLCVGIAVKELPPLTVVLARVSLASLALLPVFWYFGHKLPRGILDWLPFLIMGLLSNVVPFSLIVFGQTQIAVGLSSIINATTPLFTVIIMAAFGDERLTSHRIIGVIMGILGVAVLRGVDQPIGGSQTLGIGLCLGAALSYGFAALWGRKFLMGIQPVRAATCQLICSSFVMMAMAAIVDQPWKLAIPSIETFTAVVMLAIAGTALAYIVFFKILARAGASNAMLVTLLVPITALLLGNAFLNEPIRAKEVIGACIIGMGLLFIDGRLVKWISFSGRRAD